MQIHQLQRATKRARATQVGRGGKRGKTSGRGVKGQKSRAGRKMRPEIRDIIKKLPKLRGRGKNIFTSIQKKTIAVNLGALEKFYTGGEVVSPSTLSERGIIRVRKGEARSVKILGTGELTKKLIVEGCLISTGARAEIEKLGGEVR